MRLSPRLLLGGVLTAIALGACQPAAPVAETKPQRKSFEDSSSYQAPAEPAAAGDTQQQADQVQQGWEQVRQTPDEAERQRQAGETLKQTRAMAEEPAPTPQSP
jgi:hypothetical protein